jgi:predicted kinase
VVRRVHEAQWRVLRLAPELLDTRVLDGRIVEGHGDLRPEHIYLVPYPTIIDCVEFNAEFRQIDVLDELCFLAMECAALDAAWVGDEVIAQYCQWNADQPPAALLPFYKTYRACVRAKVSALRAEQLTGQARLRSLESAKRYLAVADVYAGQLGPTFLLMVRGLTGTGKSTLASGLADLLGVERLQTDAIRQEMFGTSPQPAAYGEGIYQPSHRARVYEQMLQRSRTLLAAGRSVILDGTFLAAKYRTEAVAAAESLGALPLIVHCQCPEPLAIQRLRARAQAGTSASESRPDIYFEQQRDEEPDPAEYPVCHADTGNSPQAVIDVVLARLKSAWAAQT